MMKQAKKERIEPGSGQGNQNINHQQVLGTPQDQTWQDLPIDLGNPEIPQRMDQNNRFLKADTKRNIANKTKEGEEVY